MDSMTEAMERMIKGRVALVTREPFFGTLAMTQLELIEDPKCETHWVDGKRLGFNPEWAMNTSLEDISAGLAHQVLTCALGHPFRRNGREEKLWNEASDYVVNPQLKDAGFSLPEGALIEPRFFGMATEAVFAQLREEQMPETESGLGESDEPSPGGPDHDTRGQEGSDPGAGQGATGEVRDSPGEDDQPASVSERSEQEDEWRTATAQAAQVAKGAGKLPGGIERAVQELLNPKVDWREALQRLMRARSKDDYSWRRPNRHYTPFDLYLPTMDAPRCGVLAFAVDMSGSITQENINQFTSEITDAAAQLRPEKVVVMPFDTRVRTVLEFDPGDVITIRAQAGGGTAFDDPVAELERREIEPEVLVYLTDLCSSRFPIEPAYPVVWVTTRPGNAPFGDVVPMY
jgi:predicted metal-dependent peptidase